jgi:hypothetical protein
MGKSHDLATFLDDGAPGDLIVDAGHQLRVVRPDGLTYGTISKGSQNSALGSGVIYNDINADGHHFKLGGVTKMNIDTAGRVTMPSQPAFRAYSNNSGWTTVAANTWVVAAIEAKEYDRGSNYNTTTYRFTAPVAGLYQFTLHIYARVQSGGQTASTNYWSARFGKNGHTQGDHCIVGYFGDGEHDNTCTITSTLDLSANDYIEVYLRGAGYNAEYYRSLCRFEGRLVG